MSIVTLKKSVSSDESPFGQVYYGVTGDRLAVPQAAVYTLPAGCTDIDGNFVGSCVPPYFVNVWKLDGYYSPGVCFSGYTIGCYPDAPTVNHEPVKPSETVAFCVPSGFTCDISSSLGYQTDAYAQPSGTHVDSGLGLAVQIRWQSSDLPNLAVKPTGVPSTAAQTHATPATVPSTVASGSTTGSSPATTGNSQAAGAASTSRLSGGAIAGIVVGVAVLLLVLVALACLLVRYRRGQRGRRGDVDPEIKELDADPRGGVQTAELPEAHGRETAELAAAALAPTAPKAGLAAEKSTEGPKLIDNITAADTPEQGAEGPIRHTPELSGSLVTAPTELPLDGGERPLPDQLHPVEISSSPSPNATQPVTSGTETIESLVARQTQLEERRQRLLELQQIDHEQDAILHQLSALRQQQQPPTERHEMP